MMIMTHRVTRLYQWKTLRIWCWMRNRKRNNLWKSCGGKMTSAIRLRPRFS